MRLNMNAFVLHATLVFLAIAGGVKCKFSSYGADINSVQNSLKYQPNDNTVQHHSTKSENSDLEKLMERCRKNSAKQNAFETLMGELQNFYTCLKTHKIIEMFRKIEQINSIENKETFFKGICNKLPEYHNCAQNYTNSLKDCLSDSEKLLVVDITNMSSAVESFMCQNDAKNLIDFFSSGGVNCIRDKKSALDRCWNSIANKNDFQKKDSTRKSFNFENFITTFKFDQEQCNDLRQVQSCFVFELSRCDRQTPADLLGAGFDLALRHSRCSAFMPPST